MTVQRRRAGTGDSPLRVLLMHGLAGGARTWDAYLEQAGPHGHELWTAELPWRADGTAEWTRRSPASWTAEALRMVPGGPDVVVAHSFAANALLALLDGQGTPAGERDAPAGEYGTPAGGYDAPAGGPGADDEDAFARHGLRGVVLVSPFYRADPGEFGWDTIAYYLNQFDTILAEGLRVRSGGRLPRDIQHEMALKVRGRIGPHGWMNFFSTYLATPYLRTHRMLGPCLVVGGERDFAAHPTDSEALSKALPDADLHLLPDCGHFAMVEQPARFTALTDGFLAHAAARPHSGARTRTRSTERTEKRGVTAR
ncbi:alpha/beta fold hydrolase [Streptomyces sp. TS71-3]|uniref:alpha/beta fold hydrolase n=1 Tax=Streptomyces sp. TS71-3 TaxID=2733862 RepID=UPI001BB31863|nr:alpha/beta hydrolase [Streptomyces sp. TS71-3]